MSQAITSHDSLSKSSEIWYDGVQYLHQSSSQFTKKISYPGKGDLRRTWAKIMQRYIS